MLICKRCDGKGYVETFTARGGGYDSILQQCCDIGAYSKAYQDREAIRAHAAEVIARHEEATGRDAPSLAIRFQDLPANVIAVDFKRWRRG